MSGLAARTTNVLPLPARPRQRDRQRRDDAAAGTAYDRRDAPDAAPPGNADEPFDDAYAEREVFDAEAAGLGGPGLDDEGRAGEGLEADMDPGGPESRAVGAPTPPHGARGRGEAGVAPLVGADDATLAQWIDRIARQDERALEALYDATAARVNGLVRRLTQRPALAEEVLEETYWQVWREAPRFDATRGRPITWLLSMARSRAIDTLRREQRFRYEALPEDGEEPAAAGSDATTPTPQDLLEATRGHAHVHAALASLEPRARQLVALAFFRGLTHEEIAAQQGMPLGTVKSLIRRALQQLRRVMEAEHA